MKRILGKSGIEVSELGLGCWAIGGPFGMQYIRNGVVNNESQNQVEEIDELLGR